MADVKTHATLPTSLISYWEMEEASGTRVDSKASNDLTDNNTVTQGTGIQGNGADFELTNSEYLSITDAAQSGLDLVSDFSISVWINLEQLPSTGSNTMSIFQKSPSGGGYRMILLTDDKLDLTFWNSSDQDTTNKSTSAIFVSGDVGNLVHIVVTVDVSASSAVMYKNGSSVGVTQVSSVATSVAGGSNDIGVGAHGTSAAWYLDGIMDELGIWSKILSSSEVTDLYNSGSGIPYEEAVTFTPHVMIF